MFPVRTFQVLFLEMRKESLLKLTVSRWQIFMYLKNQHTVGLFSRSYSNVAGFPVSMQQFLARKAESTVVPINLQIFRVRQKLLV